MMKKINFLLLFILSVFLWSCRTEIEAEPENIVGHQEASFSLLRKEQILQHKSLMSKLSEIESKRLTSNSFGRSVQDSILAGVIINTEKVLLPSSERA